MTEEAPISAQSCPGTRRIGVAFQYANGKQTARRIEAHDWLIIRQLRARKNLTYSNETFADVRSARSGWMKKIEKEPGEPGSCLTRGLPNWQSLCLQWLQSIESALEQRRQNVGVVKDLVALVERFEDVRQSHKDARQGRRECGRSRHQWRRIWRPQAASCPASACVSPRAAAPCGALPVTGRPEPYDGKCITSVELRHSRTSWGV